jgi:hypothetical protein
MFAYMQMNMGDEEKRKARVFEMQIALERITALLLRE